MPGNAVGPSRAENELLRTEVPGVARCLRLERTRDAHRQWAPDRDAQGHPGTKRRANALAAEHLADPGLAESHPIGELQLREAKLLPGRINCRAERRREGNRFS